MPRRYDDGEVSLPVGRDPEDLDWVAFAWELKSTKPTRSGKHHFIQFILGPAALVVREDIGDDSLFTLGKPGSQHIVLLNPTIHLTMLNYANSMTRKYVEEKDYSFLRTPYVVDFVRDRSYKHFMSLPKDRTFDGHTVCTLGDVLEHGDDRALQMVFDTANLHRPRT